MELTLEKQKHGDDSLAHYTSVLEDWVPNGASLAIAVGGKYIHYSQGTYDVKLTVGEAVVKHSIADAVCQTGKKMERMEQSPSGVLFYGVGYPVPVHGERGALLVILPPAVHIEEPIRILTGKQHDDWYPIPVEQVTHIESLQKKTWFYSNGETFSTNMTLKELTPKLPDTFLRVHRSYIVNLTAVQKISKDISSGLVLTMNDGSELPISQSYINEVRAAFNL
ncbi:LytTR family DNA-binding domain-containing protein [Sporosarcina cyprini]|uniref:LytTR family DNA-binding domain-containing protein n=1 Tax=Sporosarcina cyprini TaxID=2910523 RepID=UPI001EE0FF44|nr:LytTR family DNA-binding domain-containing protein [Sporosarcina cyprini]MCG3088180.1 LytTR family transcriptional regulator [Sporosarcina cyprini]